MTNMVVIQTVTVGSGGAASIDFNSIPQTYTDLVVVASIRDSAASSSPGQGAIRFNGDTASNYSRRFLRGNGTTADSGTSTGTAIVTRVMQPNGATANTFGSMSIYIPNYTNSNYKSVSIDNITENNGTEAHQEFNAGIWNSTSAISAMSIFSASGNTILQYSTATLYGVTNAAAIAKATGGLVTYDSNYFYHTFTASGTFTPTQSLTCDYLVIAGGGGGRSGGGGAGGLRSTVTATGGGGSLESPLSLTAQAYTVTIGAGGTGGNADASIVTTNGSNSVFSTITSIGGGRGGRQSVNGEQGNGGSGGGSGRNTTGIGTGTSGQGYAGGAGSTSLSGLPAGGGGGAGAVGGNATSGQSGAGGAGVAIAMSSASVTYAGGGGGGGDAGCAAGIGGSGGGGNGSAVGAATAGTANTGSGGGGGLNQNTVPQGGNGGSGIVIVRYAR